MDRHKFSLKIHKILLFVGVFTASCYAVNYQSNLGGGTGAWNVAGNWNPSGLPGAGDDVVIVSGDIITLDTGRSIDNVAINSGGELNCSGNTLTIINNLTVSSGGTWTNDGACIMGGATGQSIDFSGSGRFGNFQINNTGTDGTTGDDVSLTTDIIVTGTLTITNGDLHPGSNTVRLAGNFTKTGGELTPETSTFWFSENIAYTVNSNSNLSFYDIVHNPSGISGSKSLTFQSGGSVNYEIQNYFTRGGESQTVSEGTGANITYDSGTLRYLSTNAMTIGDEWPTDTDFPQTVLLSTSSAITNSSGGRETDNLNIDGGATFAITGGSFTLNTQLTKTNGSLTNSVGASGLAYIAGATLVYNGSTNQSVGAEWTADDAPTNLVVNNSYSGALPAINLGSGTPVRSLSGDLTLSDGSLDFSASSNVLTVSGDVKGGTGEFGTINNNTLLVSGGSSSVTAQNATTIYYLDMNTSTSGILNLITITNTLLIRSTSLVALSGTVTLSSGATLDIDGVLDLDGESVSASGATITVDGLLNLNSGSLSGNPTVNLNGTLQTGGSGLTGPTWTLGGSSIVVFDGGSQESIASDFAFDDLTISNSAGVTVGSNDPTVGGTLTLSSGKLITTSGSITVNAVSGGGTSNHVEGPLSITGSGAKTFPIGKNGIYKPVSVTGTSGTTTFEIFNSDPSGTAQSPLTFISSVRYWEAGGSFGTAITLPYGGDDGVTTEGDLRVAQATSAGGSYNSRGGTGSSGTVTSSSALGSGNFFTLGSIGADNSLPVTLSLFKAEPSMGGVSLSWSTESEVDNQGFNIYRRIAKEDDKWQLITAAMIPGAGSTAERTDYNYNDKNVAAGQSYEYMLESVSYAGVRVQEKIVEVDVPVPTEYAVLGNYPNPFNPTTRIGFRVPETAEVTLKIYGVQGNLVRELALNQSYEAGEHYLTWDGTDKHGQNVASGMYIYMIKAGNFKQTAKMLLVK